MDVRSPFHAELVEYLHEAADDCGYDLLVSTVTPRHGEARAVETLADSRCEAVVLLGTVAATRWLSELASQLPVVVVGRRLSAPGVDVVRSADDVGVRLAVEHLAAAGHLDIAYVDGGRGTTAADRRRGYRTALHRLGLGSRVRVLAGDDTEAAGSAAAAGLLAGDRPLLTAVVAFNDRSALGLLDGFVRAGVSIPDDVSVVGYDDSHLARLAHIGLTSVSQDAHRQAEQAVAAAIERLDGGRTESRQVVLAPQLVVRATTRPPPAHRRTPAPPGAIDHVR